MHSLDRRFSTSIVLLVVVSVVVLSLAGCKKDPAGAKVGLDPAGAVDPSIAVSGSISAQNPAQKAETTIPVPLDGSGKGTPAGAGATGKDATNPTRPAPKPGVIVTPAEGLAVKIIWWNDTVDKAPEGFEVVYGSQSFKPDPKKKTASGSIGPCPYGTLVSLTVYPDGRSGRKFVVPFTVTKAMEANSERDAIHVQVSDKSMRVLGNAVDNFEQTSVR